MNDWVCDEFRQVGTDYASAEEVEAYDMRMQSFRDVKGEIERILSVIELPSDGMVMEIGTGTAEFALTAAAKCKKVYAVDISPAMLEYSKKKTAARGIGNVEFIHGGFLSFDYNGPKLDAVVTQLALHHLSDFWKMVAVGRIRDSLKPGGRFYLKDVVFSCDYDSYIATFEGWTQGLREIAGDNMASQARDHALKEFSTLDWIMEGILERCGFEIARKEYNNSFGEYLCIKK